MMIRNLTLRLLCIVATVFALSAAAAKSKRPNILFVFTDDQATFTVSGHPDAHPHANTPNMVRLIKEGANLLNSFTVTPVCSPSRGSLMTSRYGSELGITDWIHPRREPEHGLDPNKWVTFPKVLSEAGYKTGLVGKWHLGLTDDKHPTKFGFQWFAGNRQGGFQVKNPAIEKDGKEGTIEGLTTDVMADLALEFLRDNKDEPFFLAVHHRAPHAAWLPVAEEDWAPFKNLTDEQTEVPNPGYPDLDLKRLKRMTREYLASVRGVDRNLGRLLDELETLKIDDNTIVIFSSDHGYNMGHNGIWHKGNGHWILKPQPKVTNPNIPRGQRPNMYDLSIKVPTFVRWPGVIKPGTVVDSTVSNLDWFPTFLGMAGIKQDQKWKLRGRDISPLLKGAVPVDWENDFFGQYSTKHQSQTDMRAWRTDRWKLVRDYKNRDRDEFYDLKNDPAESENLINSNKPEVKKAIAELDGKLQAKLKQIKDPVVKSLGKTKGKVVSSTLWDKMDIGPFYSGGLKEWANDARRREGASLALKGISIPLGTSRHDSRAALTFDTEMLRVAYAWDGSFLRLPVGRDGLEGVAEPRGIKIFGTDYGPGWSDSKGSLIDPRPKWKGETVGYGPLPDSQAHYEGLYRHGDQTVFQYRVGERNVLETHGLYDAAGVMFIDRHFRVGPSKEKRYVKIASDKRGDALSRGDTAWLGGSKMDQWIIAFTSGDVKKVEVRHGALVVPVPASDKPLEFVVSVGVGRGGNSIRWEKVLDKASKRNYKAPDFAKLTSGGPALWTEKVVTKGRRGADKEAYVVDTITVPEQNPWNSWIRCSGFDFFSDGRVALCSVTGDVWIVDGVDDDLSELNWKRYATGLFQPLGLKVVDDQIYVLGRDQITRFKDLNNDGEADFYENFNNDVSISPHYHEFCLNLDTDTEGNFYFIKGGNLREAKVPHHGCMVRVSADGKKLDVVATGHRAPNGMSVGPNNELTSSDNEGNWVPSSRLNLVKEGGFYGHLYTAHTEVPPADYDKPLCWLPHQVDNSSGGQVWVTSDKWGPFKGDMLHTSYGKCRLFKVLMEEVDGQVQGGVAQLPLNFDSGVMRGRFSPFDGQLYLAGLRVWQSSGARFGAFHRVRYTGKKVYLPKELEVKSNGLQLTFTEPLDREFAEDPESYAVDQWDYLWSQNYGSKMYSVKEPGKEIGDKRQQKFGGEPVEVKSVKLSKDGKTVFLHLDKVEEVMQMRIRYNLDAADGELVRGEIYNTINAVPE